MQQPMGNASPLDQLKQLKDIHLPESISWWPPAVGWWVLLLLVIVIVATLTIVLVNRHKIRKYRREALVELESINQQNLENGPTCEALSQLIRRTIRASENAPQVHTDTLKDMLTPYLTETQIDWIIQGKYQAASQAPDARALADATKAWIKGHKL